MIILHATILDKNLCFWGEKTASNNLDSVKGHVHPNALPYSHLEAILEPFLAHATPKRGQGYVWLPTLEGIPVSSIPHEDTLSEEQAPRLGLWKLPFLVCELDVLEELYMKCTQGIALTDEVFIGVDVVYLCHMWSFSMKLLQSGAFIPSLDEEGQAFWMPLCLEENQTILHTFIKSQPALLRYYERRPEVTPSLMSAERAVFSFLSSLVDYFIRAAWANKKRSGFHLNRENTHVLWLAALGWGNPVDEKTALALRPLVSEVAEWNRPLSELAGTPWSLVLKLEEPQDEGGAWRLSYLLQSLRDRSQLIPATEIIRGRHSQTAVFFQEPTIDIVFLRRLAQLAREIPAVGEALKKGSIYSCLLSKEELVAFLERQSEKRLFPLVSPKWWQEGRGASLALRVNAPASLLLTDAEDTASSLEVDWKIAVGEKSLKSGELKNLQERLSPLFLFHGNWVWLTPKRLQHAINALKKVKKMGRGAVVRALIGGWHDGFVIEAEEGPLLDALNQLRHNGDSVPTPAGFLGQLRPYQQQGYSWMVKLTQMQLGACLADDMGLGKTVQTLALIQRCRHRDARPVLLVCPLSVMENWKREAARFTPTLSVLLHQGSKRAKGEDLIERVTSFDVVLVSYPLLQRDGAFLQEIKWQGIVLDEAQFIKNSESAQARAARALVADWRIALTGTPIENHLGDLWAIMEFLNPGYLGPRAPFYRRYVRSPFADMGDVEELRQRVGAFILRRLKSDPKIVPDLPPKIEDTLFCGLKKEQSSLYTFILQELREQLLGVELGLQRRGIVLAAITHLKQICNHPALFLGEERAPINRSGKLERLLELCDRVHPTGEKMLIFTQYVEMGNIIQYALRARYGMDPLFLHGGLSRDARESLIYRFQNDATQQHPFFILSLKAGGSGLNLTNASHVVLFDRWWNPATEQQAIDRAHRIGQKKVVQVHLLCCRGTLEDKIDALVRAKKRIAGRIIETGEQWLTELGDEELQRILSLDENSGEV